MSICNKSFYLTYKTNIEHPAPKAAIKAKLEELNISAEEFKASYYSFIQVRWGKMKEISKIEITAMGFISLLLVEHT